MFKKLIKDELDTVMTNTLKLNLEYMNLISKLKVEYQTFLDDASKKFEAMQKQKNDEIKTLKQKLSKYEQKYV